MFKFMKKKMTVSDMLIQAAQELVMAQTQKEQPVDPRIHFTISSDENLDFGGDPNDERNYEERYDYYAGMTKVFKRVCAIVSQKY